MITKRTYESEMYERAIKKLGLDQAIFLGGNFKSTADLQDTARQISEGAIGEDKKLNKQEMETLLKKGILGLMEEEDANNAQ